MAMMELVIAIMKTQYVMSALKWGWLRVCDNNYYDKYEDDMNELIKQLEEGK